MQLSGALRGPALGRCWGGAGRCLLPLPLPQAAPGPHRCLHHKQDSQDSPDSAKDSVSEDHWDAIIVKLQQILVRPKSLRVRGAFRAKGKGGKGRDTLDKAPYQPFSLRIQGNIGWDVTTGQKDVTTGHNDVTTGHNDVKIGHYDVKTGHYDVKTGHNDVKTGHYDVKMGHNDVKTGHYDVKTGHKDVKTYQDMKTDSTQLTSTQIAGVEMRRDECGVECGGDEGRTEDRTSPKLMFSKPDVSVDVEQNDGTVEGGEKIIRSSLSATCTKEKYVQSPFNANQKVLQDQGTNSQPYHTHTTTPPLTPHTTVTTPPHTTTTTTPPLTSHTTQTEPPHTITTTPAEPPHTTTTVTTPPHTTVTTPHTTTITQTEPPHTITTTPPPVTTTTTEIPLPYITTTTYTQPPPPVTTPPHTTTTHPKTTQTQEQGHIGHTRTYDPKTMTCTDDLEERGVKGERKERSVLEEEGEERGVLEEEEKGVLEGEEKGVLVRGEGRALSERESALLCQILDNVEEEEDRRILDYCLRQGAAPSFDLLRRVCAVCSCGAGAGSLAPLQELARRLYPSLYLTHLGLDYYWARALCHEGKVEESLGVLLHLFRHTHPQRHKKVRDVTQSVLYRIVEGEQEEEVAKAVDFVDSVAAELGQLNPALSLWTATFASPTFRMQQVSEWLMKRHPKLAWSLGRRVEGLVERAAWAGDQDLLQRLLHLILRQKMTPHYPATTSALLQLQCDTGDLRGAEETIKFAQKMEIRVTPSSLHRFLALLSRHRRPAPLALLALKYRPTPARTPIPPTPTPKYRF